MGIEFPQRAQDALRLNGRAGGKVRQTSLTKDKEEELQKVPADL